MRLMRCASETGTGVATHRAAPAGSSLPSASAKGPRLAVGGLVFDMVDVLYDATLWRRWLVRLVNNLGVRASYASFFEVWEREYLADVHRGRREYNEAFQSFLLASHLTWAQIDEIEAASRIQRQNLESNVRPLPGVVKTISRLAESGLALAAFADAPCSAARLSERLERLGLGRCFGSVLSSFDLEAVQPSVECYRSLLEALGRPAQTVAYVGHDAEHLAGAKAIGMQTVAFNFEGHAQADFYLTRFEELSALVGGDSALAESASVPPTQTKSCGEFASPMGRGGRR